MIWAVVLFVVTLALKLAFDIKLYFSGKKNRHQLGPALVLVSLVTCSYFGGWHSTPFWFFAFWNLFDVLYAFLIGQAWNYVGTTAFLDRMQRKYLAVRILKLAGLAISIILLITH